MITVVEKAVAETLRVGLRYWPPDLETGETITAVETAVSPSGLTLDGDPLINGAEVYQKIKDGTAGIEYWLLFIVTTSRPETLANPNIDALRIRVV